MVPAEGGEFCFVDGGVGAGALSVTEGVCEVFTCPWGEAVSVGKTCCSIYDDGGDESGDDTDDTGCVEGLATLQQETRMRRVSTHQGGGIDPSPTMFLQVSGRNSTVGTNETTERISKNQKILRLTYQSHDLHLRRPLDNSPMPPSILRDHTAKHRRERRT